MCDVAVSAKELVHCKSYELGDLVAEVCPQSKRRCTAATDSSSDVNAHFLNSTRLHNLCASLLEDAESTLQLMSALNALPLAVQISQIAGNVLSRTLMGGRSERNEYLLMHAFSDAHYIYPDKALPVWAANLGRKGGGGKASGKAAMEAAADTEETVIDLTALEESELDGGGGQSMVRSSKRGMWYEFCRD